MNATSLNARERENSLDEALVRVHRTSPIWRDELANHAPMAAEALVQLGRPDAIGPFLDVYEQNLEPATPLTPRRDPSWEHALGDKDRLPDLCAHFEAAIAADGVDAVIRRALPKLLPGVLAASLHGLLRLAHGLRAFRHADSPVRQREIAYGLGYWGASYAPLAGEPGSRPARGRHVVDALAALSPLPPELAVEGIITTRALKSSASPTFLAEIRAVDFSVWSIEESITELCRFAASLLIESRHPRVRFCYLHAVTGTSALRQLLPWLDDDGQRAALAHHWHALAAIQCMTREMAPRLENESAPVPRAHLDGLIDAAVATRDDHAIKLTATVMVERAFGDDPRLLQAAWAYVDALGQTRSSA